MRGVLLRLLLVLLRDILRLLCVMRLLRVLGLVAD